MLKTIRASEAAPKGPSSFTALSRWVLSKAARGRLGEAGDHTEELAAFPCRQRGVTRRLWRVSRQLGAWHRCAGRTCGKKRRLRASEGTGQGSRQELVQFRWGRQISRNMEVAEVATGGRMESDVYPGGQAQGDPSSPGAE